MNRYKQIIEDVEEQFSKPQYLEHKIHYVSNQNDAEICISAQHTMGDYLLVGIRALQRSINGVPGDILVFNNPSPDAETIGTPIGRHTIRKIEINTPIYLQARKPIEDILQHLYKGKHTLPISEIGLSISFALSLKFSEADRGIPEEIMSKLQFTHFDDVKTAEKDAFILITGASVIDDIISLIVF